MESWRRACQLWDPAGERRRRRARRRGVIVTLLGLIVVFIGGINANSVDSGWQWFVAVGAVGAGAGLAVWIRAWELRVRTPAGSALWTQVESFRRFLAGFGPNQTDEVAAAGRLGQYAAWAVALGETNRWATAIAASTVIPSGGDSGFANAPMVERSAVSSSTAPLSVSSDSGFSGGSVGGGSGGGGGGSW